MTAALSIVPVEAGNSASIAEELVRIVKASGLRYRLTPTGTCIEGSWAEIFTVAKTCHDAARVSSPRVVTLLGIEDDATGSAPPFAAETAEPVEQPSAEASVQ